MDQSKCSRHESSRERISLRPESCSDRQPNNITRIATESNGLCIFLQCKQRVLVLILH